MDGNANNNNFDPTQAIIDTANQYGVDPDFALKIAHQESGINPNVRDSSAGAIGIMQLMPNTAKGLGVDPRNPMQNIDGGVRYLKQMQDQFNGDPSLAAAAYNAGPGRVRSWLNGKSTLPAETQNYITSVGNSPVSAKALGYTSAPAVPATAQGFIANPDGGASGDPQPPPGFELETSPAAASDPQPPPGFELDDPQPPPGFELDDNPNDPQPPPGFASPANTASFNDRWGNFPTSTTPTGGSKSIGDRLQKVWDNPTPGGLVSIVKGIYDGLDAGASATKDAMNGADPTSDAEVNKVAQATMNLLPTGSAGVRLAAPARSGVTLAAADRLGIAIPKYMATDGYIKPALAAGVRTIPFANTPIEKSAQGVGDAITTAVNQTAPQTSIPVAGSIAKDAIKQGIKTAQGGMGAAYDNVNSLLTNPGVRVPLTNTAAKMQELADERENANLPEWGDAMKTLLAGATNPKGMNYQGIKTLRSYLAESHPGALVAQGLDPTETKRLYGPLTQDLQTAVKAGGGQPALDAWQSANDLAKSTIENRDQLYKIIGADADTPPEAVFGKLAHMASDSTSGNLDLLQRAKDAMDPQAWKGVGDAVISGLGRDPLNNVTAARFVTDYQKLSDTAKNILFTPQQKSRLDDVLSVSNLVKTKVDKYANTSNTAHNLRASELIAAVVGGAINPHLILPALGGAVGGRVLSQYLSRPAGLLTPKPWRNNPVLRGLLGTDARGVVDGLFSPGSP